MECFEASSICFESPVEKLWNGVEKHLESATLAFP